MTGDSDIESKLAAAEQRYETLFEFLPEALVEFSIETFRVTRANLVARIIGGYTEADVEAGIMITDMATPESLALIHANVTELVATSLQTGEPYQRRMEQNIIETTLRRKDGSIFPAELQGSIVTDDTGRPIGVQVIGRDITARKAAEAEQQRLMDELRRAQETVHSLEDLLPVCAWCRKVRDDDGYWSEFENYVVARHGANLSHGICPDCARRYVDPDKA